MKAVFTYQFRDLREARADMRQAEYVAANRVKFTPAGWLLVAAYSAWLVSYLVFGRRVPHEEKAPQELWASVLPILGPPVLLLVSLIPAIVAEWRVRLDEATNLKSIQEFGNSSVTAISWLVLAVSSILLVDQRLWIKWHPSRWTLVSVGLVAWTVFDLVSRLCKRALERLADHAMWESQSTFQGETTLLLDDLGFRLSDTVSEHFHCWDFFGTARETAHLFVLYSRNGKVWDMIPKRAFSDATAVDQCRGLLASHIPSVELITPSSAFLAITDKEDGTRSRNLSSQTAPPAQQRSGDEPRPPAG